MSCISARSVDDKLTAPKETLTFSEVSFLKSLKSYCRRHQLESPISEKAISDYYIVMLKKFSDGKEGAMMRQDTMITEFRCIAKTFKAVIEKIYAERFS